jgi:cytokinesis protein
VLQFDTSLCTEGFLDELQSVLPDAGTIGKLNAYKTASDDVLETLHKADRLLVELIKIEPLLSRVKTMRYRVHFDETMATLRTQVNAIIDACGALKDAPNLRDLLNVSAFLFELAQLTNIQVALTVGNFLNASGAKGGAFGFRLSSLNKVRLTKSSLFN